MIILPGQKRGKTKIEDMKITWEIDPPQQKLIIRIKMAVIALINKIKNEKKYSKHK